MPRSPGLAQINSGPAVASARAAPGRMAIMTSEPEPLWLIDRALDQTAAVIEAVAPDQAPLPTPCRDWDVLALVTHIAGQDLRNFIVSVRGETADWQAPPEDIGDDWAAAFTARAQSLEAE